MGTRNALYKTDIIIIIIIITTTTTTSCYHSETRLLLASVDIAVHELQAMMTRRNGGVSHFLGERFTRGKGKGKGGGVRGGNWIVP